MTKKRKRSNTLQFSQSDGEKYENHEHEYSRNDSSTGTNISVHMSTIIAGSHHRANTPRSNDIHSNNDNDGDEEKNPYDNDDDDDDDNDDEETRTADAPSSNVPLATTATTLTSNSQEMSKRERRARAKALKKQKRIAHLQVPTGITTIVTPSVASEHPFNVEPRDHAETPFEAYADIEPLLFKMAQYLGKTKETVILYDPYYCEGSMRTHLNKLGFPNVINENKDFYQVIKTNTVPHHDILVTNPPFSSDHMERILQFCVQNNRPYFLLLPQFVAKKGYYLEQLKTLVPSDSMPKGSSSSSSSKLKSFTPCKPIYVGPTTKAYSFTAPQRDHKGTEPLMPTPHHNHKLPFQIFSGSFQCIWFIFLGLEYQTDIVKWWRKKYDNIARCKIEENDVLNLPQLMAVPQPTPAKRRWRKKISRLHKQMNKHTSSGGGRNNEAVGTTKSLPPPFVPGLNHRPGSKDKKKV